MEKQTELTLKEQYLMVRVRKYLLKTKQDPTVVIMKLLDDRNKEFRLDISTEIANNNIIDASLVLGIAERTFHRQRADVEKKNHGTANT